MINRYLTGKVSLFDYLNHLLTGDQMNIDRHTSLLDNYCNKFMGQPDSIDCSGCPFHECGDCPLDVSDGLIIDEYLLSDSDENTFFQFD